MIVPDLNLLVYAYNADLPQHAAARTWWEGLCNGREPVGLPWAVACGFIRLMTHPRVVARPLDPTSACACVQSWLTCPTVLVLDPGPRHLALLADLLAALGHAGPLTTDAHLAALAIEHDACLHSNDADFARFAGLRWRNPLS
jgi:toxin-antitoxin system PIN domain toxin